MNKPAKGFYTMLRDELYMKSSIDSALHLQMSWTFTDKNIQP